MKPETAGKVKFGVWGLICGAIIAIIIGFTLGGWVTSATAHERIDKAVLPLAAEICADNFKADPDFKKNLAALKEKESWQRDNYIEEKGKWAVMPGDDAPRNGVAEACVGKLSNLLK